MTPLAEGITAQLEPLSIEWCPDGDGRQRLTLRSGRRRGVRWLGASEGIWRVRATERKNVGVTKCENAVMPTDEDEILDILDDFYYFRERTPGFALGPRADLVYAFASGRAVFSGVNATGPDPREYVEFARHDVGRGTSGGFINSLSNAKRSVHLSIQGFLQLHCLERLANKMNFPQLLELLDQLQAFPTRLVASLNRRRNVVEHEYSSVAENEARDFLDVAELFVTFCYRYFVGAVVSVYVGRCGSEECFEYALDPSAHEVVIQRVEAQNSLKSPHGIVHYNLSRTLPKNQLARIPLDKSHLNEWLPILNLLVYCTREAGFRLPRIGQHGQITPTQVELEVTNVRDEFGRRQTRSSETIYAPPRPEA